MRNQHLVLTHLSGFCLPCPSRPCWRTTQVKLQRSHQTKITAILTKTKQRYQYKYETRRDETRRDETRRDDAMRCDAMRCDAIKCNAMQCNAMQCNAIQYYTILYYTILYYTILYYTIDPLHIMGCSQSGGQNKTILFCPPDWLHSHGRARSLYDTVQCNAMQEQEHSSIILHNRTSSVLGPASDWLVVLECLSSQQKVFSPALCSLSCIRVPYTSSVVNITYSQRCDDQTR